MPKNNHEAIIITPEKARAEKAAEAVETKVEKVAYTAEQKTENIEKAEAAVKAAEKESKAAEKPALPASEKNDSDRPVFIDNAMKILRRKQSLKHIQRRLKPASRALSKVVHQPLVRAVSETGAKSVARPSGLFGGGLMAFIGSLLYLYLAKHVGFQYNYLVFALFFVGGFVLGLLIELLLWAVRPKAKA